MSLVEKASGVGSVQADAPTLPEAGRTGRDGPAPDPSAHAWQRRYATIVAAGDLGTAVVTAGVAAAFAAVTGLGTGSVTAVAVVLLAVWPFALLSARAYEHRFLGVGSEEFRRVLVAGVGLLAVVSVGAVIVGAASNARPMVVALTTATLVTLAWRYAARRRLHARRKSGLDLHRVVLVGHPSAVLEMTRELRREPYHGLEVVGACLPMIGSGSQLKVAGVPVVGDFETVGDAVEITGADTVAVLACPELDGVRLRRLSWQLETSAVDLLVAPALMEVAGPRLAVWPAAGLPLLHVDAPELSGGRRFLKTSFDRTVAALALMALAVPLLLVGLAVRVTSSGPALFRQRRVGLDGREFEMLKFRSMVADAEARRAEVAHLDVHGGDQLFKIPDDPRVTTVGRFLRRFSLDELPQLVNVLRGEMSLVGPRPPLPDEVARYAPDTLRRLRVKPGLTGLWQVSGRADLSVEESVRLDLRYVENWSLSLDSMILWKTARAVFGRAGAY